MENDQTLVARFTPKTPRQLSKTHSTWTSPASSGLHPPLIPRPAGFATTHHLRAPTCTQKLTSPLFRSQCTATLRETQRKGTRRQHRSRDSYLPGWRRGGGGVIRMGTALTSRSREHATNTQTHTRRLANHRTVGHMHSLTPCSAHRAWQHGMMTPFVVGLQYLQYTWSMALL